MIGLKAWQRVCTGIKDKSNCQRMPAICETREPNRWQVRNQSHKCIHRCRQSHPRHRRLSLMAIRRMEI